MSCINRKAVYMAPKAGCDAICQTILPVDNLNNLTLDRDHIYVLPDGTFWGWNNDGTEIITLTGSQINWLYADSTSWVPPDDLEINSSYPVEFSLAWMGANTSQKIQASASGVWTRNSNTSDSFFGVSNAATVGQRIFRGRYNRSTGSVTTQTWALNDTVRSGTGIRVNSNALDGVIAPLIDSVGVAFTSQGSSPRDLTMSNGDTVPIYIGSNVMLEIVESKDVGPFAGVISKISNNNFSIHGVIYYDEFSPEPGTAKAAVLRYSSGSWSYVLAETGSSGGGEGAVEQILPGSYTTVSPSSGTGVVTVDVDSEKLNRVVQINNGVGMTAEVLSITPGEQTYTIGQTGLYAGTANWTPPASTFPSIGMAVGTSCTFAAGSDFCDSVFSFDVNGFNGTITRFSDARWVVQTVLSQYGACTLEYVTGTGWSYELYTGSGGGTSLYADSQSWVPPSDMVVNETRTVSWGLAFLGQFSTISHTVSGMLTKEADGRYNGFAVSDDDGLICTLQYNERGWSGYDNMLVSDIVSGDGISIRRSYNGGLRLTVASSAVTTNGVYIDEDFVFDPTDNTIPNNNWALNDQYACVMDQTFFNQKTGLSLTGSNLIGTCGVVAAGSGGYFLGGNISETHYGNSSASVLRSFSFAMNVTSSTNPVFTWRETTPASAAAFAELQSKLAQMESNAKVLTAKIAESEETENDSM